MDRSARPYSAARDPPRRIPVPLDTGHALAAITISPGVVVIVVVAVIVVIHNIADGGTPPRCRVSQILSRHIARLL